MASLSPAATIASRGKAVVGEVRVRDQLTDELLSSFSQPISNQTQIPQPSPAATERQPQRCTRSFLTVREPSMMHVHGQPPSGYPCSKLTYHIYGSMTEFEPVAYLCKTPIKL